MMFLVGRRRIAVKSRLGLLDDRIHREQTSFLAAPAITGMNVLMKTGLHDTDSEHQIPHG